MSRKKLDPLEACIPAVILIELQIKELELLHSQMEIPTERKLLTISSVTPAPNHPERKVITIDSVEPANQSGNYKEFRPRSLYDVCFADSDSITSEDKDEVMDLFANNEMFYLDGYPYKEKKGSGRRLLYWAVTGGVVLAAAALLTRYRLKN